MPANEPTSAPLPPYRAHCPSPEDSHWIGISLRWCRDANFIDQAGTPVIDGLGPIGAGDHSPREYMVKDSLPQRTLLLASVLADYVWGNKRY